MRENRRSFSSDSPTLFCANNGWTFDNCRDPLNQRWFGIHRYIFQSDDSILPLMIQTKYLTREIVVWSDCMKLRYFDEAMNPTWFYEVIKEYIQILAVIFDGFRLDNCHNTSLHLLEQLLKEARRLCPDLFIFAELFTQDQSVDIEYISKLGIDVIVRETAKKASYYQDVRRYTDLLFSVGGEDLGSLHYIKECPRHVVSTVLPSLLYDMTHDNKSLIELYGPASIPSITVMLGMAVTHVASTKGVDDGYPLNPLVTEYRHYQTFNNSLLSMHDSTIRYHYNRLIHLEEKPNDIVHLPNNCYLRLLMNHLHCLLNTYHFTERYIHHYHNSDIVSVERYHPDSLYSVISITNTAFNPHPSAHQTIELIGRVIGVFLSVHCLEEQYPLSVTKAQEEMKQQSQLSGIPLHFDVNCYDLQDMCAFSFNESSGITVLQCDQSFSPGSSVVLLLYNGQNNLSDHFLNYHECNDISYFVIRLRDYSVYNRPSGLTSASSAKCDRCSDQGNSQ